MVTEIKDLGKERLLVVTPDIGEKSSKKKMDVEYTVNYKRVPLVKVGDKVVKGQMLTDGSASIDEIFKYGGRDQAENYIITEVSKLYELQGEPVSRKHIELIVRQMFSRKIVKDPGQTNLSVGDVISVWDLSVENDRTEASGKEVSKAESTVMGITEISLSRRSFLSAASFQHTTRVIINAAVRGTEDKLVGLKENVIIGRLIPAGSGFPDSPKSKMVAKASRRAELGEGK